MSHSYKKHFVCKAYGGWGHFMKKYSNRKLRRKKLSHDYRYKSYRKDTNTWDIYDDTSRSSSFESYYQSSVRRWRHWQNYSWGRKYDRPTRREEYKDWLKWYKRK